MAELDIPTAPSPSAVLLTDFTVMSLIILPDPVLIAELVIPMALSPEPDPVTVFVVSPFTVTVLLTDPAMAILPTPRIKTQIMAAVIKMVFMEYLLSHIFNVRNLLCNNPNAGYRLSEK